MHAYATLQLGHRSPDLRLTLDHFLRRIPIRPFLLVVDGCDARPLESASADAHAVADGPSASFDQIEEVPLRIDHDRARRLGRGIVDGRTEVGWIDIRQSKGRDRKGLVVILRIDRRIPVRAAEKRLRRLALSVWLRYWRPPPAGLGLPTGLVLAEEEETILSRSTLGTDHSENRNAERHSSAPKHEPQWMLANQYGHFDSFRWREIGDP